MPQRSRPRRARHIRQSSSGGHVLRHEILGGHEGSVCAPTKQGVRRLRQRGASSLARGKRPRRIVRQAFDAQAPLRVQLIPNGLSNYCASCRLHPLGSVPGSKQNHGATVRRAPRGYCAPGTMTRNFPAGESRGQGTTPWRSDWIAAAEPCGGPSISDKRRFDQGGDNGRQTKVIRGGRTGRQRLARGSCQG